MMARLAADGSWQTDAEHRLLPLSAELQQRLGVELAERMQGRTCWDAHRGSLSAEPWAEHRAELDARRPFRSLQFEIEAGEGRWLWISISGVPRFDADGHFLGYLGVGRDITARQQAHELRTPIGHVQGLAQMLGERGASRLLAEDRELLQLQVQAAQRMRETVDALLALARSTLQTMPLERKR